MWNIINSLIQNKSRSSPIMSIKYIDKTIVDNQEIAEIFSDYYKYAAYNKVNKIVPEAHFESFLSEKDKRTNTFHLEQIDDKDVWKLIRSLKPKVSSSLDEICNKLVCRAAPHLISPLRFVINKCFSQGQFPDQIKISKISPLYKRSDYQSQNFQPVSIQSTFSKLIEKAAKNQLTNHNEKEFPESSRQFSYKAGHSTAQALILARHEIEKALELNKFVLAIFIDLSVAFDSIDVQEILPRKLEHLGADKRASGFFKSFFNNRKHYVEWNSKRSKINDLYNISVCQGSCLGPVCYNTYTHDYKDVIGGCDDSNCKVVRATVALNFKVP